MGISPIVRQTFGSRLNIMSRDFVTVDREFGITTVFSSIIPADPRRVFFYIAQGSMAGGTIFFRPLGSSNANGFQFTISQTSNFQFDIDHAFQFVQGGLEARVSIGTITVYVVETFFRGG